MNNIRQIESWRAEEIAKVYLLNSGLVTLVPEYNSKFDFLAISKRSPEKKIAVEVKATRHTKEEIKKVSDKTKKQFSSYNLPILLMYINDDKENGFFEVINEIGVQKPEIHPLQQEELEKELSKLMR